MWPVSRRLEGGNGHAENCNHGWVGCWLLRIVGCCPRSILPLSAEFWRFFWRGSRVISPTDTDMRGLVTSPAVFFARLDVCVEAGVRHSNTKCPEWRQKCVKARRKNAERTARAAVDRCEENLLAKAASYRFAQLLGYRRGCLITSSTSSGRLSSVIITTGCVTSWARLLDMFTKWWADITASVTTYIHQ